MLSVCDYIGPETLEGHLLNDADLGQTKKQMSAISQSYDDGATG